MGLKKKPKSRKEYNKKWIENNKERHKANCKKWREENREKLNEWYKEYRKKNYEQYRETEKRRYKKHRLKILAANKERIKKRRLLIIKTYGSKCKCCGESKKEFLAIDHINGGGYKERKKFGAYRLYGLIIKNNFPATYQLLCHNCNQALGIYGYCPHKRK